MKKHDCAANACSPVGHNIDPVEVDLLKQENEELKEVLMDIEKGTCDCPNKDSGFVRSHSMYCARLKAHDARMKWRDCDKCHHLKEDCRCKKG